MRATNIEQFSFFAKTRCLAFGLCSASSRLSSLLGSLAVQLGVFSGYPAVICGALSLAGGVVLVFLLPEPDAFKLTERTRFGHSINVGRKGKMTKI